MKVLESVGQGTFPGGWRWVRVIDSPPPLPMTRTSAIATDLAVGIAAGLTAALAMGLFQSAWDKLATLPKSPSATEKAADKLSDALAGKRATQKGRKAGASLIHYLTGAIFGGVYGVVSGVVPALTAGRGALFAGATWFLGDELAVPALGLGSRPDETPPKVHAFGFASHLVFGLSLDLTRRYLNGLISARR